MSNMEIVSAAGVTPLYIIVESLTVQTYSVSVHALRSQSSLTLSVPDLDTAGVNLISSHTTAATEPRECKPNHSERCFIIRADRIGASRPFVTGGKPSTHNRECRDNSHFKSECLSTPRKGSPQRLPRLRQRWF
jgi:hypothetical protein